MTRDQYKYLNNFLSNLSVAIVTSALFGVALLGISGNIKNVCFAVISVTILLVMALACFITGLLGVKKE